MFWKKTRSEKVLEISRKDHCTTGTLLDYLYHQNYYKLIATYLSRQTDKTIPQQINLTGKLEEGNGVAMFFVVEKQQKTFQTFSLVLLIVTE